MLFRASGGQRHIHNTVLRGELFPSGRLDGGQQRGVDRGRRPPAGDERHRFGVHTARQPPDDGHDVGRPDGRVDGRVRRLRVGVRAAAGERSAVRLGAAGVHPVQRERQHAGHGSAAVDDDRRAVPAQGARHNGRPGAVAGLLLHIRHGENVAGPDDGAGHRSDHVAVRGRRRVRRVLRGRVPAGDAGQDAAPDREAVQQRRPVRRDLQGRRGQVPGEEVQARRCDRGVHHQFVGGRVSQMTDATTHARTLHHQVYYDVHDVDLCRRVTNIGNWVGCTGTCSTFLTFFSKRFCQLSVCRIYSSCRCQRYPIHFGG